MKTLFDRYVKTPLVLRIVLGLAAGVALGLLAPGWTGVAFLGTIFVGLLKAIAPLLVFVLVIAALANAGHGIGKRFRTVLTLYMTTTLLAAVTAVAASFVFRVTVPLPAAASAAGAPQSVTSVLLSLIGKMVENPLAAIIGGNYIGVLFWAVLLGIAFKHAAGAPTKQLLADASSAVSAIISWIIQCAPFGVMGLVFASVGTYGMGIFIDYGKLLALLVGCILVTALVLNPLVASLCMRRNAYPLVFTCLKESGVPAFFTRSSAANIPINMALCEKLGMEKPYYSVAIPLGATINMEGAAITISLLSLAAAFTTGVEVNLLLAFFLCFISSLGACGASGVAGGSLFLIPMACSLLGVSQDAGMQMIAVGFIIGVIQDSMETMLNSSSDVVFAATAEHMEAAAQGRSLNF